MFLFSGLASVMSRTVFGWRHCLISGVMGITVLISTLLCSLSFAAAAQAPPNRSLSNQERVVLSFRDVEIAEVLAAFSQSTGKAFVSDPRVKGKISLDSPEPVTLSQAYNMLSGALALAGFALIEQDGYVKVLPLSDARSGGIPLVGDSKPTTMTAGLRTQVFVLQHESAVQVLSALRALVPASNPITAISQSNALVVSDTVENLRNIERVIAALDKPKDGYMRIYEVKHALAIDVAQMVDRLVNSGQVRGAADYSHARVTLMPVGRTNSLLIHGFDQSRVDFGYAVAEQLDSPNRVASNLHVVYLKHADAAGLAATLQGIFRTSQQINAPGAEAQTGQARNLPSVPSGAAMMSGPQGSLRVDPQSNAFSGLSMATGDVRSTDGVIVRAEPAINALLVVAPDQIFRQMRQVIDQLDVRRAQVYIESLIVEVNTDRFGEFGVQFQYLDGLGQGGSSVFGGSAFSGRSGAGAISEVMRNPLAVGQGLSLGVVRGTVNVPFVDASGVSRTASVVNLGVLARALETQGVGNVIATPNLLTLDNEEARIVIGQNVPFVTGNFSINAAGAQGPFQTIERKDVGTTLRVKPTVTEGGSIRLQLFQEVSSVVPATVSSMELAATQGLTTNRRAIESTVVVEDEQIIVIGGLIEDREQVSKSKVPLLGDIPLLGALFRYDSISRVKTNLMVFLRPVIIRNADDANILSSSRYQDIRRVQGQLPASSLASPEMGRRILEEQGLAPVKKEGSSTVIREGVIGK